MPIDTRQPAELARRATPAIAVLFLTNGVAAGSWLPRLPEIQDRLDISDAALGLTLVGGGIGGLVMSAFSGRIVARWGSKAVATIPMFALAAVLPVIAIAPTPVVLFLALLAVGAIDGVIDVAQNTQAVELQDLRHTSVMSRLHAMWSIGLLSGGAVATLLARLDVDLRLQLAVTAVVLVLIVLAVRPFLLPSVGHRGDAPPRVRRRRPSTATLVLVLVGVTATLAEMPLIEWSSLVVQERFDLTAAAAALGFVSYAAGMVVGRLGGDAVVDHIGLDRTRRLGAGVGLASVAVVAVSPGAPVAFLGLFVAGLGVASLFPAAVRQAGHLTGDAAGGVATFAAGSRGGILLASPLMGLTSDLTTRSVAIVTIVGVAAAAQMVVRLPSD
jgi:MFS family permease